MSAAAQLGPLGSLCPGAELWTEGGKEVVFLPGLRFKANGATRQADALLWPWQRDGYESRLFLSEAVPGKGQNWNSFHIQGRTWFACSWNGVSAALPWIEILVNHLRAFK